MTRAKQDHDNQTVATQPQRLNANPVLGLDLRDSWWRIVLALATALILGLGALQVIDQLARPLAIFFLGITIAAALAPIVSWLDRWLPRALAVVLLYLLLALVLLGLIGLLMQPLIAQFQGFSQQIPSIIERVEQFLNRGNPLGPGTLVDQLLSQLGTAGSQLVSLPLSIASSIFEIFLVIFISIYALIVTPQIQRFILSLVPGTDEEEVDELLAGMAQAMGGYVRGVVITGAVVGLLTYPALLLIGIQFALALSVFAALMEIIPFVGPLIAGIAIVAVALLEGTNQALIALVTVIVIQQIENHIIVPNVMRSQTSISPLLVILALYAGGAVGGILGALVAIPLVAALREFVVRVIAPAVRRWTGTAVIGGQ